MSKPVELNFSPDNLEPISLTIPDSYSGMRVDTTLAELITDISRTKLVNWLKANHILIEGKTLRPKDKILGGEHVIIIPMISEEQLAYTPTNIDINIIYEDNQIIVINKPAGLVVHPGNGNWTNTLLNGLLFHYPELAHIPRAGIVHRLDKDTSGLMVVAKTLLAQTRLVQDLQKRQVTRIYRAIVEGNPYKEGMVTKNIGRDPSNRIKMSTIAVGGKEAITRFKVLKYFDKFSYIECKLETGRTHQIRVHMKSINHPIVGDKLYNIKKVNYPNNIVDAIESLDRQALHAIKLSFNHPETNQFMQFKSSLPYDIKYLLSQLMTNEQETIDDHLYGSCNYTQDNNTDEFDDENDAWEVIYTKE